MIFVLVNNYNRAALVLYFCLSTVGHKKEHHVINPKILSWKVKSHEYRCGLIFFDEKKTYSKSRGGCVKMKLSDEGMWVKRGDLVVLRKLIIQRPTLQSPTFWWKTLEYSQQHHVALSSSCGMPWVSSHSSGDRPLSLTHTQTLTSPHVSLYEFSRSSGFTQFCGIFSYSPVFITLALTARWGTASASNRNSWSGIFSLC